MSGVYVTLADTIKGFNSILSGDCDSFSEQSFYLVGNLETAEQKESERLALV